MNVREQFKINIGHFEHGEDDYQIKGTVEPSVIGGRLVTVAKVIVSAGKRKWPGECHQPVRVGKTNTFAALMVALKNAQFEMSRELTPKLPQTVLDSVNPARYAGKGNGPVWAVLNAAYEQRQHDSGKALALAEGDF